MVLMDFLNQIGPAFYLVWVIFTWSYFYYKDTPLFKIAETAALATTLGNILMYSYNSLYIGGFSKLAKGDWLLIVPLTLGLLLFTMISKEFKYLAKWPTAMMIGAGMGLAVRGAVDAQLIGQLRAFVKPLWGGQITPIDNLVSILMAITILSYFLFTFRQEKGILKISSRIGRYAMMMMLGGYFGSVVLGRLTKTVSLWTQTLDTLFKIFKIG